MQVSSFHELVPNGMKRKSQAAHKHSSPSSWRSMLCAVVVAYHDVLHPQINHPLLVAFDGRSVTATEKITSAQEFQ